MAMTTSQYYKYRDIIKYAVDHGTKEGLEEIYKHIIAETGDYENLKSLDSMYNRRWTIL